jgi:hypothetical protein
VWPRLMMGNLPRVRVGTVKGKTNDNSNSNDNDQP